MQLEVVSDGGVSQDIHREIDYDVMSTDTLVEQKIPNTETLSDLTGERLLRVISRDSGVTDTVEREVSVVITETSTLREKDLLKDTTKDRTTKGNKGVKRGVKRNHSFFPKDPSRVPRDDPEVRISKEDLIRLPRGGSPTVCLSADGGVRNPKVLTVDFVAKHFCLDLP